MRLISKDESVEKHLTFREMQRGDVGVIVESPSSMNLGVIVKRHMDIVVGLTIDDQWHMPWSDGNKVRVFEKGTTLTFRV